MLMMDVTSTANRIKQAVFIKQKLEERFQQFGIGTE